MSHATTAAMSGFAQRPPLARPRGGRARKGGAGAGKGGGDRARRLALAGAALTAALVALAAMPARGASLPTIAGDSTSLGCPGGADGPRCGG